MKTSYGDAVKDLDGMIVSRPEKPAAAPAPAAAPEAVKA